MDDDGYSDVQSSGNIIKIGSGQSESSYNQSEIKRQGSNWDGSSQYTEDQIQVIDGASSYQGSQLSVSDTNIMRVDARSKGHLRVASKNVKRNDNVIIDDY